MQPYLTLYIGYPAAYLSKEDAFKVEAYSNENRSYEPLSKRLFVETLSVEDGFVRDWQDATFFIMNSSDTELTQEEEEFIRQAKPLELPKTARLLAPPPVRPEIVAQYEYLFVELIGVTTFQPDKVAWYCHVSEC